MKNKFTTTVALLLAVCMIALSFGACGGSADDSSAAEQTVPATIPRPTQPAPAAHRIDVGYLSQVGLYPCGCESVSAVMALNHAGYEIDVDAFIENYLPMSDEPYYDEYGYELCAASPYEYFIGSPYSDYSYGCYAPVIRSSLEQILSDSAAAGHTVVELSGTPLSELCRDYISRGIPVIVWGTIGMQPISGYTTWLLPNGEEFTWRSQEHCLLLVGYDKDNYYFNDPMEGKNTAYAKADAEQAYAALYSQALAIVKK